MSRLRTQVEQLTERVESLHQVVTDLMTQLGQQETRPAPAKKAAAPKRYEI